MSTATKLPVQRVTHEHPEPVFVVTLKAQASPAPAARRLARLLKFAGRTCGMKCIDVKEAGRTGTIKGTPSPKIDTSRLAEPSISATVFTCKPNTPLPPQE